MECAQVKYKVVHKLKTKFPVQKMCRLLGISRSGYYQWLIKQQQGAVDRDMLIARHIKECQDQVRYTYGYRRVQIWLLGETGLNINHKAVLRIMNKYSLCSRVHRGRRYNGFAQATYRYENKLQRNFQSVQPNLKWVTDITQFRTISGILYLSAIKDLYDGSIVGFMVGKNCKTALVLETLKQAITHVPKGNTAGLTIHSDQGCQYTSYEYHKLLDEKHIQPSMSRPGTPIDNAPIESFFSTIKVEWLQDTSKMTMNHVNKEIMEYITFYNNVRIKSDSGMPPLEKRRLAA